MWPKLISCMFLVLFPVAMVVAQDGAPAGPAGPVGPSATVVAALPPVTGNPAQAAAAGGAGGSGETDAKLVGGMSILGNKEAPMSLFIVPWKTSELGAETNLTRTLNERRAPVDRDVFLREVAFYQVSAGGTGSMGSMGGTGSATTAVSLFK